MTMSNVRPIPRDDTSPPSRSAAPASRNAGARGPRPLGRKVRTALAVIAGRASGGLARRAHLGGGTSLPGLVARRISPDIVPHLAAQLRHGSVLVTGTNGKTTTSGMTAYVLRAGGLRVWRNREGANLLRGITAALIIRSRPDGRLRWSGDAAAVFEVDEAAVPQAVAELEPRVVAVTNLFRDQLDRYGEVDTVAERWRTALNRLPSTSTLVLNADDPTVAALGLLGRSGRVVYFGVSDAPASPADPRTGGQAMEVVDTRTCPRCRAELSFSARFYSHIGHWSCASCGLHRPDPAISARDVVAEGVDATRFQLATPHGERPVRVALPGLYNVYNALAAAAIGYALEIGLESMAGALERFTPAFGRAERIMAEGREVRLLLAKNPTGLNEVLRVLATTGQGGHALMLLNDHFADGQDVSWIWDADVERVASLRPAYLATGGTRAYDLALRLKYADCRVDAIEPDVARALWGALEATPEGQTLYVIPTFTAMLTVRGELERRGYAPHYWEQRDA